MVDVLKLVNSFWIYMFIVMLLLYMEKKLWMMFD